MDNSIHSDKGAIMPDHGQITLTVTVAYRFMGFDDTDYTDAMVQEHVTQMLQGLEASTLTEVGNGLDITVKPYSVRVQNS
jgi:hypothetical protein